MFTVIVTDLSLWCAVRKSMRHMDSYCLSDLYVCLQIFFDVIYVAWALSLKHCADRVVVLFWEACETTSTTLLTVRRTHKGTYQVLLSLCCCQCVSIFNTIVPTPTPSSALLQYSLFLTVSRRRLFLTVYRGGRQLSELIDGSFS